MFMLADPFVAVAGDMERRRSDDEAAVTSYVDAGEDACSIWDLKAIHIAKVVMETARTGLGSSCSWKIAELLIVFAQRREPILDLVVDIQNPDARDCAGGNAYIGIGPLVPPYADDFWIDAGYFLPFPD